MSQEKVWVPEDTQVFVCCEVVSQQQNISVTVNDASGVGGQKTFDIAQTRPHDESHDDPNLNDLALLSNMTEAPLIGVLRRRFLVRKIYTYVSDVIIAINPYRFYPELTNIHRPLHSFKPEDAPHIFAIADKCYRQLIVNHQTNHSVIVSGESGAGKTEACKNVMQYLAVLSQEANIKRAGNFRAQEERNSNTSDQQLGLEDKVLKCNPFLEAFGNAKTVRNDNSSRFGKFIQIIFCARSGVVQGARMDTYLLEKSRVVTQADNNRSYHIFYYLLAGASESLKTELGLQVPQDYCYLNNAERPCFVITEKKKNAEGIELEKVKVDDNAEFQVVCDALEQVHITADVRKDVWQVLAAILALGNIKFETNKAQDGTTVSKKSMRYAELASKLLGISDASNADENNSLNSLVQGLCVNVIEVNSVAYTSKIKLRDAKGNCDALSKKLYEHLFSFLVRRTNRTLRPDVEDPESCFVGILDIFGFEIFKINSFEQLCINYANEVLQLLFCDHVFKGELAIYEKEGIDVSDIDPPSNQPCVDLIGKGSAKQFISIFQFMDEKSNAKSEQTDEAFLRGLTKMYVHNRSKLSKRGQKNASYFGIQHRRHEIPKTFLIKHFAGPVTYTAESMIAKNRDKFPVHLENMLLNSSNVFVQSFFNEEQVEDGNENNDGHLKNRKKQRRKKGNSRFSKSIASTFRAQLGTLIHTLHATSPHFIRCIKPNSYKLNCDNGSRAFDSPMILSQLLFSGVMETVKIRQDGFPFRKTYADLWAIVGRAPIPRLIGLAPELSPLDGCLAIAKHVTVASQFRQGRTKLFAKDGFEQAFMVWQQNLVATIVHDFARNTCLSMHIQFTLNSVKFLQLQWRCTLLRRHYQQVESGICKVQALARAILAQVFVENKLHNERAIRKVKMAVRNRLRRVHWRQLLQAFSKHAHMRAAMKVQLLIRSAMALVEKQHLEASRVFLYKSLTQAQTLMRAALDKTIFDANIKRFTAMRQLQDKIYGGITQARFIVRVVSARHQWRLHTCRALLASNMLSIATRRNFVRLRKAALQCQKFYRHTRFVQLVQTRGCARLRLQSFARLALVTCALFRCRVAVKKIQALWRGRKLYRRFKQFLHYIKCVQLKFLQFHFRHAASKWLVDVEASLFAKDVRQLQALVECVPRRYSILRPCPNLVNIHERSSGRTSLHFAVRAGHLESVKYLIWNGADALLQDVHGNTPLHLACQIEYGSLSNSHTRVKMPTLVTKLSIMVDQDAKKMKEKATLTAIVKYLLSTTTKSLSMIKNKDGHTPYLIAQNQSEPNMEILVALRLQMGVDMLEGKNVHANVDVSQLQSLQHQPRSLQPSTQANVLKVHEHVILPSASRQKHFDGANDFYLDDTEAKETLIFAQLMSLRGAVDPVTRQCKVLQRRKAAVTVQKYVRKYYSCKETHQASNINVMKKGQSDSQANSARTRIRLMQERRAVLQQRLLHPKPLHQQLLVSTINHNSQRQVVEPGSETPENDSQIKVGNQGIEDTSTRCEGDTITEEPGFSQRGSKPTPISKRSLESLMWNSGTMRQRSRRWHQQEHRQQSTNSSSSVRGIASANKDTSIVDKDTTQIPKSKQKFTNNKHSNNSEQQKQNELKAKQVQSLAQHRNVGKVQQALLQAMQSYWCVMGVQKGTHIRWWVRYGFAGNLKGPVSNFELNNLIEEEQHQDQILVNEGHRRLSLSLSSQLQCRHAGMPNFVAASSLRGLLVSQEAVHKILHQVRSKIVSFDD